MGLNEVAIEAINHGSGFHRRWGVEGSLVAEGSHSSYHGRAATAAGLGIVRIRGGKWRHLDVMNCVSCRISIGVWQSY